MGNFLTLAGVIVGSIIIYFMVKRLFPWFKTEYSYNLWPGVFAQIVELGLFAFSFDTDRPWNIVMLIASIIILVTITLYNIVQTKVSSGIFATLAQMIVAAGIVLVIIVVIILLTDERKKKKHH